MVRVIGIVALLHLGLIVGCSVDSSSEVSDKVDELVEQSQQQQAAEQQAAAEASQNSSSSSSSASSSSSPSSSSSSGGAGGFVWKPISEGDGNLVVLLPSSLRGKVTGAYIMKGGSVVESGRFSGDTHNGNRPHYRYSKPGAGYGSGLTLAARLKDGTTRTWSIPNGGKRVG